MAKVFRTDIEDNGKVDFLSRPILRTNPKLTTNVKLVLTDDNMYLESIDASSLLSGSRYKKFLIKETGSYSYDVSKFWNSTSTPLELAFQTKREYSDFSILDSYEKQFEETYCYGTTLNYSKLYNYDYRMFAPIWLDKNIPTKFIIYRVKDPINSKTYSDSKNLDRINEMLSNSTLIKTVDLSEDSKIGKYLRNHVNSDDFPNSPLSVSFNKDGQTFYNGIDLEKGGFANKDEYQYKDTINTDKPLIEYNEFITNGFFRNKTACANLINLEFLFDDDEIDEFSINRYFGVYVDEHKLGEGNVKRISDDIVYFSEITHEMGLGGLEDKYAIPSAMFFKSLPTLGWVKSFSDYHNIKNGVTWNSLQSELKIDTNSQDYNDFTGIKKTERNISVVENVEGCGEYIEIKIESNPLDGDTFSVFNLKRQRFLIKVLSNNVNAGLTIKDGVSGLQLTCPSGQTDKETLENIIAAWQTMGGNFTKYDASLEETAGKYQIQLTENQFYFEENHSFSFVAHFNGSILKVEQTFTPTKTVESTFTCNNSIPRGKFDGFKFSGNGSVNNVANAIANIIAENTNFETTFNSNVIYIKSKIKGYNKNKSIFIKRNDSTDFMNIPSEDVNNALEVNSVFLNSHTVYSFTGGAFPNKSLYVDEDDIGQVNIGEFLIDTHGRFNKIVDIVEDTRDVLSEKKLLVLKDKNKGIKGSLNVYRDFRLEWGYFSAYDVYDLDFDFYDNSSSDLKELNLETVYSDNDNNAPYEGMPIQAFGSPENLKILSEDYFSNLIPLLEDENSEDAETDKIYSEFDRLQENNTAEFATVSRIVPTINKWSLLNSKNVRENPYYLNVNEALGETNFSPNLETEERDKDKMTHEWFYMDMLPSYINSTNCNDVFSYVNPAYQDNNSVELLFDEKKLTSIEFDYFKSYFLSNGFFGKNERFCKTKEFKKYTHFSGGSSESFASTIFKGLRFIPKLRKKLEDSITKEFVKTKEFNGYRFSTCLKTTLDKEVGGDLKIQVIENKKYKCITLVLNLTLSEDKISFLNRKMLYELDHRVDENGVFTNSKVDGALNLSNVTLLPGGFSVVKGISSTNGTSPKFNNQILPDPDTGSYGFLKIIVGQFEYSIKIASVINQTTLLVFGQMIYQGNPQSPQFYTQSDFKGATYEYQNGGIESHAVLLEKLSANSVATVLNETNNAEYITVNEDGSVVNNRFSLHVEDGVEVLKRSTLSTEVDTNKPKSFQISNEVIGYNIQDKGEYFAFLTRQNGDYTVNMKPIITFTEPFSNYKIDNGEQGDTELMQISLYKKLNNCKIMFNVGQVKDSSHDNNWGIIKNHFFHKVNEIDTEGVIKLTEGDALLPKYNLINEIAIDKKDKNVFKSRWENDYYVRNLSGGDFKTIPGTRNIIEEKSYMGSSVIKTGESYNLFEFTTNKVKTIEELNLIRENGTTDFQINFVENKKEIILDFYIKDVVISKLDNLGVRQTIRRYVLEENSFGRIDTLDDDVDNYISENIIRLYSISSIDLHVIESKRVETEVVNVNTLSEVTRGGYVLDNNFTYKLDSKNPLNFRLIYNKRLGFSYKIKPLVKIKA